MSITRCSVDTNVIGALPEAPTLPASELQGKFDEAATKIKEYMNSTMLQEIEELISKEKANLQTNINNAKTELLANISEQILEDNKKKYYIGKIIIDTENINPATYLGFGAWEPWGSGRFPVGVDETQEEFATVEKTGGGTAQSDLRVSNNNYAFTINTNNVGTSGYGGQGIISVNKNITEGTEAQTLEDNGLDLKPPYITCYMWKRVS